MTGPGSFRNVVLLTLMVAGLLAAVAYYLPALVSLWRQFGWPDVEVGG